MNKKIIYFSLSVWALLSACTAEQSEVSPNEDGRVTIQAAPRSTSEGEQTFKTNEMIVVYNGIKPNEVYDKNNSDKIGIYKSTAEKADAWENLPLKTEEAQGLWKSSMDINGDDDKFIFTATTYHDGQNLKETGVHQISPDQTSETKLLKNDFLVARNTYDKADWNGHISLTFRHVLSRLDIKLFLPIGNESDGFFKKEIFGKTHTVTLKNAALDYNVNYTYPRFSANGIADINTDDNSQTGDIKMYPFDKKEETSLPGSETTSTQKAVMLHFQCILPKRQDNYTAGSECLDITIDGKKYIYKPEKSGIMSFEQERVTTINLTLYSKKGQNRVTLNGVQINDWKEDKTNMGDLIE